MHIHDKQSLLSDCDRYRPVGQCQVIGIIWSLKLNVLFKAGHCPSHSSTSHSCECSHNNHSNQNILVKSLIYRAPGRLEAVLYQAVAQRSTKWATDGYLLRFAVFDCTMFLFARNFHRASCIKLWPMRRSASGAAYVYKINTTLK